MTIAEQVVKALIEKNWTISCAESCTGGKLTGAIVDVADASKVLEASIVTYSNEAKQEYLQVQEATLAQYGAVSEETAREMAIGIAKANHAQVGVAVTGTAGPGGGTEEKPIGTVCFGFYVDGRLETSRKEFGDLGRNVVRAASVEYALQKLYRYIQNRA